MRWIIHGERPIYESEWVNLSLVDVEIPGHERFEHHVVRFPRPAAGAVVHDPERGILLLWRHRFTTDTWGWEIPAGGLDEGESFEDAAIRETIEEAGWRPGPMTELVRYHPINGSCDQTFVAFLADGASYVGPPTDVGEAERIEWLPVPRVREELAAGRFTDGLSLTALLYAFTFGHLDLTIS